MANVLLIADRDQTLRDVLEKVVARIAARDGQQHKLTAVATAGEALSTLESGAPDVLIADSGTKGLDTVSFLREVRRHPNGKNLQLAVTIEPERRDPLAVQRIKAELT